MQEQEHTTAGLLFLETHTNNQFANESEGLHTTLLRPPLESSRQGESRYFRTIFV